MWSNGLIRNFINLFYYSYFEDILQQCNDCDEIQFLPNGDWSRIEVKKKGSEKTNKIVTSVNTNDCKFIILE